jgi:hypothetical protein
MTLYIANTTRQNWNHHFRVPEMSRPYFVQIPAGRQVKVNENLGRDSEDAIIRQLLRYGGRNANEVSGRLEQFPGIFFRTDRAISESEIVSGHEAVLDHAERRSADEATRSALAFDAINRDSDTNQRLARETQVEIIQEVPKDQKRTGEEVNFSVSVAENGSSSFKMPGA